MELYRKHRPASLSEVRGQEHIVEPLTDMLKKGTVPHFLLLSGGTGWGKTTVARILKTELKCSDTDFVEMNAATGGGVDFVRDVKIQMRSFALGGEIRMWLVDEAHCITAAGQKAFLKETEDTPDHVHFIFASSEADSLLQALRTRAMRFDFKPLKQNEMLDLMHEVLEKEGVKVSKSVVELIAENCEGSARQALVMLEQAIACKGEDKQLESVRRATPARECENFCKVLLEKTWMHAAEVIKKMEADPESTRRGVLAWMSKGLLEGWIKGEQRSKAVKLLTLFQYLFSNGKPDLVLATWTFFNA